jgi:hypothetical protein
LSGETALLPGISPHSTGVLQNSPSQRFAAGMKYHSGKLIEDNQMVDCTGRLRRGKHDPTIGIGGVEKEQ